MKTSLKIKAMAISIILVTIFAVTFIAFESNAAVDPSTLTGTTVTTTAIENLGNQAITIVSTIGSVAAVIVLIVLGLKYMMGSTEEKAEYKKTLMPYVIGAILVFAASAIAGVVFSIGNGLSF